MSELTMSEHVTVACPGWCVNQESTEAHPHVSADVYVDSLGQPLTARLVQVTPGTEPRIVVNGQVATLRQAATFAREVRRLTDEGTLADAGFDFVLRLAGGSEVTIEEMALATGLDVERLRAQERGRRELTVHEVDRLAMAVVHLAGIRDSQ